MNTGQDHIQVFNDSGKDLPIDSDAIHRIVALISKQENCSVTLLEVVFVDEEEIVRLNRKHLDRDYITDVISFPYENNENNIEGTVFICAPRVYEQALEYNENDETEFKRVVIHGILHLTGYLDNSEKTKKEMTKRENYYLSKLD